MNLAHHGADNCGFAIGPYARAPFGINGLIGEHWLPLKFLSNEASKDKKFQSRNYETPTDEHARHETQFNKWAMSDVHVSFKAPL